MYCKAVYWNHIYSGAIRDAATVEESFLYDLARLRPSYVTENKTRVFVSFHDGSEFIYYTMPIEYKKQVKAAV